MKSLTCLFVLAFAWFSMSAVPAAAPPARQPDKAIVYLKPVSFRTYTFKDKSKGFTMRWDIKKNDFPNKKVPDSIKFYFHGPQPIDVQAFEITGWWENNNRRFDRIEDINSFSASNGMYFIRDNLRNNDIRLITICNDPVERYENKWKDFELKVVGKYADKGELRWRIFQKEVMRINGVVGCGADREKQNDYRISVAKGHPNMKEIKEKVEKLAKKQGMTVVEWDEREGYDYTWEKPKLDSPGKKKAK